jgi:hypothetical protein
MITSAVARWGWVSLGFVSLVGCSVGDDAVTRGSQALDDGPSVVLRQTSLYQGGCQTCTNRMAIVMTTGRAFEERVSLHYRRASGEWVDQQGSRMQQMDGRGLWLINNLPPDSPLVFDVHYQTVTSGGMWGPEAWDNNGGAHYSVAGDAALGPGIDIAAANVSIRDTNWAARLVVRNLSPQKTVTAVYSTDGWKTTQTATAHFDHGGGDGADAAEVWTVGGSITGAASAEFAFQVEQAGRSSWDNNLGMNYRCLHDSIVGWSCGTW